jgi:hypothetical protein
LAVLTVSGAEIDRRRWEVALLAPQAGKDLCKRPVAILARQQAQRVNGHSPAAAQFQATGGPVGQAMSKAKRRRVHRRRLSIEHTANKRTDGYAALSCR